MLAAALLVAAPLSAQRVTERYDPTFRKYSKRFFGVGFDWRIFKAQAMAESRLDPLARSQVGARGIMQLMPSTFQDIQSRNPDWVSVDDEEWNIAAGIFYDRQLWRLWSRDVASEDQYSFMFASYNAGRVPILTAQRLAVEDSLDPRRWTSIDQVAPKVPRWRHRETLGYLLRIAENRRQLDVGVRGPSRAIRP